jgi:nucleoside-diphosphate-sugar epimerase
MPCALIAGCGYVGRVVADLLTADGWALECWTLSPSSASELSAKGYQAQAVDISNQQDVGARKAHFDAVIHCASTRGGDVDLYRRVYLRGASNLIECFNEAKILFTSSTSVYAQSNGESVTEDSTAAPKHASGQILIETEQLVLSAVGIVARLGGIYGPGRSALLKRFLSGEASVDPQTDRFVNQIHRDDVATALQFLLKSGSAAGQIYNVVDDQPILLSECYRWMATKLERPLPRPGGSISHRKRGDSNKRVSNAKLRSAGWSPQYPTFAAGMGKSVLPSFGLSIA